MTGMINVLLRYGTRVTPRVLSELVGLLPMFVARALPLTPRAGVPLESEFVAVDPQPYSVLARNVRDIGIVVLADDYMGYMEDLARRLDMITGPLGQLLAMHDPSLSWSVSLHLSADGAHHVSGSLCQ